jgi:predicted TPR repeat methyltransferase
MSDKIDAALRNLLEALRLTPNNPEANINLGKFYYFQGQIRSAIPFFQKAIRLDSSAIDAHFQLANCFVKLDMMQQAIDHYQVVVSLNPYHANAKLNLAMAYISQNDYMHALPFLTEAAALDPGNAELQGHLAECYLDLGDTAAAIKQFELALNLDPNRAAWQHNLAVLYLRDNNITAAQQHFEKALELDPSNDTAQHMLNALNSNLNSQTAPQQYVNDLFDQYASYYNAHMRNRLQYDVPAQLRQAINEILNIHTKQLNILDLGCGTGLCGVYFSDLANFMVGVDLSQQMLNQAKNLPVYEGLCRCDINQILPGYNMHVFDLVLAADVFVYIGDLTTVFQNVKTCIKSQGLFAFTVEFLDAPENYQLQPSGRFCHSKHYIEELAIKFGLSVKLCQKIILREQNANNINGLLFVLSE